MRRMSQQGPMSFLDTYSARPWAKAIKEEVLNRRMPPWGAVKGLVIFAMTRASQDEITRIAEWVEGGAPEGDPAYLPPFPKSSSKTGIPRGRLTKRIQAAAYFAGYPPASFGTIRSTDRQTSRWLRCTFTLAARL